MKNTGIAYVLWFFLGLIGIHKFYVGKNGMGITYLLLFIIGWATTFIFIGWAFLIVLGILLFIDLFTLPSQVRIANDKAAVDIANFNKKVNNNMNLWLIIF